MSFSEFIYNQDIIGVTIGTISGFAISGVIKDINNEVIVKLIKNLGFANAGIISSLIEFVALMLIVYILYHTTLYPVFKKHIELEKKKKKKIDKWRDNILYELKNIDMGSVYI